MSGMDVKPPKKTMTEPIVNKEGAIDPAVNPAPTPVEPTPGSQTDPALLLKSLQDEREKRRIAEADKLAAEAKLKDLEARSTDGTYTSDEAKLLKQEIDRLSGVITNITTGNEMSELTTKYPALKDKATEFEEFRAKPENQGMPLATAGKAFLVENDLLEVTPRKGLERGGQGGGRATPKEGLSAEEIADLRQNNFRKYSKMVQDGEIKI